MIIADGHNDFYTSGAGFCLMGEDSDLIVNYAVWGTALSEAEVLEIGSKVRSAGKILSFEDVSAVKNPNKIADLVPIWCSLCWNEDNWLAGGALGRGLGLSKSGKKYVKMLEKQGIFIDSAHLSPRSLDDLFDTCELPIVNSHSCVFELCKHPRNVSIMKIGELLSNNGYFGVCLHAPFLNKSPYDATVRDVVRHVDHIVQKFGDDGVGLGTDFYGSSEICRDLNNYQKFGVLYEELFKLGYGTKSIEKIFFENFLRIYRQRYGVDLHNFVQDEVLYCSDAGGAGNGK